MTTASSFQSLGLSIQVEDPLIKTNRTLFDRITERVDSYSHEIRAIGGYFSARMRITDTQVRIEDWIEKGLGRHIVVHNPAGIVVWEGFVNKLTANLGRRRSVTIDCLGYWHFFKNFVYVNTTEERGTHTGANNASVLTDAAADFVNDGVEIGMLIKNLTDDSEGTITAVTALTVTATLAGGTDNDWDTGDEYRIGFTQDLDKKIQAVVATDPNGIFSTDYSKITSNTLQVDQYDNNNRRAETIIKELNTWGDASLNRYNVGVYANRQVVYSVAPSTIAYQRALTDDDTFNFALGPLQDIGNRVSVVYSGFDNSITPAVRGIRSTTSESEDADSQTKFGIIQKVLSIGGATTEAAEQIRDAWIAEHAQPETSFTSSGIGEVTTFVGGVMKPWDVVPGNWVFFPQFLAGRLPPTTNQNFKDDPRVGYIENVKFTAPNQLNIDGRSVSQMGQVLARFGLLGVGV